MGHGQIADERAPLDDEAGRRGRQGERGRGVVGAGCADAVLGRRPGDARDEPGAGRLVGETLLGRLRRGAEMDEPILQAEGPPVGVMTAGERQNGRAGRDRQPLAVARGPRGGARGR